MRVTAKIHYFYDISMFHPWLGASTIISDSRRLNFPAFGSKMEKEHANKWQWLPKYRVLLALVTAALLVSITWIFTYFLSAGSMDASAKQAWLAVVSTFVNLASTAAVFVVAALLFQREDDARLRDALRQVIVETQDRPVDLSQIRFADLIDDAKEIDFVVQGWDGWASHPLIEKSLPRFFERGGTFRLYVCNPETDRALSNRTAMEQRLGRSPSQVADEIRGTIQSISEARASAVASKRQLGKLEVFPTDRLNWYFAAYFRTPEIAGHARLATLVLSVYSHTSGIRPWSMPAIQIPLNSQPRMQAWFENELRHLRDGAAKASNDDTDANDSEEAAS